MNQQITLKSWLAFFDSTDLSKPKKPTLDNQAELIAKYEKVISTLSKRYQEQCDEVSPILIKVSYLENERKELQDKNEQLTQQKNKLQAQLDKLQDEDQKKQDEMFERQLQAGLSVLNDVWKSLLQKVGIVNNDDNDALAQLQALYDQEVERVYNQVCESIESQNLKLKDSLMNNIKLQKEIKLLKSELDNLNVTLAQEQRLSANLKLQIQEDRKQMQEEKEQIRQELVKHIEISEQLQQNDQLNQKIRQDVQLLLQDGENKLLQEKIKTENLKKDYQKCEQELREIKEENNQLIEQIQKKEEQIRVLEIKKKNDYTENIQLKKEIQSLQAVIENLKAIPVQEVKPFEDSELKDQIAKLEQQNFDYQITLKELQISTQSFQNKVNDFQNQIEEKETEIKDLKNQIEAIKTKRDFGLNEITRLTQLVETLKAQDLNKTQDIQLNSTPRDLQNNQQQHQQQQNLQTQSNNQNNSQQIVGTQLGAIIKTSGNLIRKSMNLYKNPYKIEKGIPEYIVEQINHLRNSLISLHKYFLSEIFKNNTNELIKMEQSIKETIKHCQDLIESVEDYQSEQ